MTSDPSSDSQLVAIKNITTASTHGSGLLSVLRAVTKEIVNTLGYGRVIIGLKGRTSGELRFRIGRDREVKVKDFTRALRSIPPVSLKPDPQGRLSVSAWSLFSGRDISVMDATSYDFMTDRTFQEKELVDRFGLKSYYITPIFFQDDSLGVIIIDDKYISRPLDEKDRRVISTIADHLSVCLANVEILNELKRSNKQLIDTNRELIESQKKYQLLVERSADAIFIIQDYCFVYTNKMFQRMFGYSQSEIIGKNFLDFVDPQSRQDALRSYEDAFNGKPTQDEYEYTVIRKGGGKIVFWMKTAFIHINDRLAILCFAHDITEKKRAEAELREAKAYLENILESANDPICIVDLDGRFTYVNKKIEEYGYTREELIGKPFLDILSPKHTGKRFKKGIASGVRQTYEIELFEKGERQIRNIVVSTSPLLNEFNSIEGVLVVGKDITDRKRLEEELKRLSITDNLTDLFNQRYFFQRIKEEADRSGRMSYPICLIIFDIDNFKYFNDTKGHLAGDEVLRTIGTIIRDTIRSDMDTAFRYGGDEFAIILPDTTLDQAEFITERIREKMFDEVNGLAVSFGISSKGRLDSIEDFINAADQAMYRAKEQNRVPMTTGRSDWSCPS